MSKTIDGIRLSDRITVRRVEKLIPYARNAKLHPEAQVRKIAASIREFGFTAPVLTRGDDILAGHGRVLAAEALGLDEVPTVDLSHLSPTQAKAYILADNRIAESPWDAEMLALELEELQGEGYDLDLTGFDQEEIENFLSSFDDGEKAEKAPETSAEEIDTDEYKMQHCCPRCGFEFNDEKA